MNWITLSLIAPAIAAVVNYIDKYVIDHQVKDYRGMPVYGAIASFLFGSFVWLGAGFPLLSLRDGLLLLSAGIITMWGYALYFQVLSTEETSYVITLIQAAPIFTLLLSYLLLGEKITGLQLLGFILVISSAFWLSLDTSIHKIAISTALWLTLLASFLFGLSSIVIKFTLDHNSFPAILSYEGWGIALGGASLYVTFTSVRNAFWQSYRSVGTRVLAVMFLNEGLFLISKATAFFAISLGSVALVSVLGATQAFYSITYGIVLTLLFPKLFHEDIRWRHLVKKIGLAAVLIFGIWLL